MSNSLNHNVPSPSDDDLPETSNDDHPEEQEVIPKPEVPFVSRYGMKHAKNSLQDVEFFRATLFNLKTEPVEDRERRFQETNRIFLRRCREPEESDLIDEPVEDLQPEETNTEIKTEPIDETEEGTSSMYMETEPLDYPPEFYSESTENSSNTYAYNLRENELENNRMFSQQRTEPEPVEEMGELDNLPLVLPPVLPVLEPEEINGSTMQLVVPEAVLLNTTTETLSSIDTTTNLTASDLDNGNTNIIENAASVPRKTRKKRDVIPTPTRVSTRIKKPRIMYNI